jgi:biotin transport system substrate-specific component
MVLGTLLIYAIGVPALAMAYPMELGTALQLGALVFLPWDVAKVAAAALLLPVAWRLAGTPRD